MRQNNTRKLTIMQQDTDLTLFSFFRNRLYLAKALPGHH